MLIVGKRFYKSDLYYFPSNIIYPNCLPPNGEKGFNMSVFVLNSNRPKDRLKAYFAHFSVMLMVVIAFQAALQNVGPVQGRPEGAGAVCGGQGHVAHGGHTEGAGELWAGSGLAGVREHLRPKSQCSESRAERRREPRADGQCVWGPTREPCE